MERFGYIMIAIIILGFPFSWVGIGYIVDLEFVENRDEIVERMNDCEWLNYKLTIDDEWQWSKTNDLAREMYELNCLKGQEHE